MSLRALKNIWKHIFRWEIWRVEVMATVAEIQASIAVISQNVVAVDARLDEVAARISALEAGQVVTPEQLADIFASLESVKSASAAIVSETSSLVESSVVVPEVPVEPEPTPTPVEE